MHKVLRVQLLNIRMQEQATMRLLCARLLLRLILVLIKLIKIKMRRLQECLQSIRFQVLQKQSKKLKIKETTKTKLLYYVVKITKASKITTTLITLESATTFNQISKKKTKCKTTIISCSTQTSRMQNILVTTKKSII